MVKILVGPRQLFRAINWEGVFARESRAEAHGLRTILITTTYESPTEMMRQQSAKQCKLVAAENFNTDIKFKY